MGTCLVVERIRRCANGMCPAPAKGVGATAGEAEVRNRNMKLTIECGSWCLAQEKRPETLAPPPHFHPGLHCATNPWNPLTVLFSGTVWNRLEIRVMGTMGTW
ncbi:hypothetical protein M758_3G205000 [Ceratodon purpureus]|nr:hypothetical protein M758_3G205000 [Ceratodon purpureus]